MNKKILVSIVSVLALMLLVAGCSKQGQPSVSAENTAQEEQTLTAQIDSVDQELADADKLSQDLSTDELDNVDKELADVETLDIQ